MDQCHSLPVMKSHVPDVGHLVKPFMKNVAYFESWALNYGVLTDLDKQKKQNRNPLVLVSTTSPQISKLKV